MRTLCTLGVDIGTSSSKGVLVSATGRVLGSAVREHDVQRPHIGWVEMDADVWWSEFVEISRELTHDRADIVVTAVGVSGMGPCVLLTDADGHPVRPAILYGVDTRAVEQIQRLTQQLGEEEIARRCGSILTTQAAGPKIAWIREEEPEAYARAERLFMPASWLVFHLTGEYTLDHHSASQCTPMFDLEALRWYEPWAEQVATGISLPRLGWADDIAGRVSSDAAEQTGIPAGTPVIFGTIDAWSEASSVGAHEVGDLMLMYGTTMFLIATVDETLRTPSMWSTAGALEGIRNLAGGMATSGAITGWLRTLFGNPPFADLVAEAATSGPGARGLLMLPYFAGERTPIMDPAARGAVLGLTISHNRGDLYRAVLEATAFGVRHNIETMRKAGAVMDRIVAVGGGTQGGLWTQIVSDITGLPQVVRETTIGASYGAAYFAARAGGSPDDEPPRMDDWNPVREVVQPNPDTESLYQGLYDLYVQTYLVTRDVTHALGRTNLEHP
ncbi:MAG: FGGY-family carbohydrate kinase [Arachnia sp.]